MIDHLRRHASLKIEEDRHPLGTRDAQADQCTLVQVSMDESGSRRTRDRKAPRRQRCIEGELMERRARSGPALTRHQPGTAHVYPWHIAAKWIRRDGSL